MTMNRKAHNWKRRTLCITALLICLAAVATGTAAYFTAEETAYNVITTGCLYMDLVEETTGGQPWPEEGISGVMPGMAVDKVVYVKNTGSVPFYVRVSIDKTITAAAGSNAVLNFDHISMDLNTEQWSMHDGFYYYYRALQPGENTEPLMTKVTFAPAMTNEYMDATVQVDVLAQAVQSANNGSDPVKADGWSEPMKTVIKSVEPDAANEQ